MKTDVVSSNMQENITVITTVAAVIFKLFIIFQIIQNVSP